MFISYIFGFHFAWLLSFCNGKEEKVFQGRLALKGEFPSAVVILEKIICGGTLVALDKVFTAAHCVVNNKNLVPKPIEGFTIYGDTLKAPVSPNYQTSEGAQSRKASSIKIHEKHSRKKDMSDYYDIALITLDKPFVETKTFSVAKFLTRNEKELLKAWKERATSKKSCIGVGWGTTAYVLDENGTETPGIVSEDLKALELTPVDPLSCSSKYLFPGDEDMNEKGEVCVSSNVDKGESVCKGDSGSPLYCDGYAFGLARAVVSCGVKSEDQFYLLFGPFFDYFGLGSGPFLSNNARLLFIVSSVIILRDKAH